MELQATAQDTRGSQEEREWELTDEELDRAGDNPGGGSLCHHITSRPCSTSRCHCR